MDRRISSTKWSKLAELNGKPAPSEIKIVPAIYPPFLKPARMSASGGGLNRTLPDRQLLQLTVHQAPHHEHDQKFSKRSADIGTRAKKIAAGVVLQDEEPRHANRKPHTPGHFTCRYAPHIRSSVPNSS
ncbi:hypothetical protein [Dyella terrae]|uniref:hypothetical protein n=1 Tax=Dyella terrae TaxID=522259 RepID=UPI001EFE3D26|nr:hypothetical protein [Dyella terrae]